MTIPSTTDNQSTRRRLLRAKSDDGHARVTFVELFFDLVFVFAITQLSHLLLHHLTVVGALETLLLLFAVWWVWIYTSWTTNWLDPETTSVRGMLFALMLGGLVLAASIPKAFESKGLWFAAAYVAMQVGRSLFMLWALREHTPTSFSNFQRITIWLAVSGVFWIAGGLVEGAARPLIWTVAIAIEMAGPWAGFRVPGLGRSAVADWDIAGGHLAERCGLFVIIALGESLLLSGATFAELTWTVTAFAGLVAAVVGSIAMWWIYFHIGAERASRMIAATQAPGALARLAYTYLHVPIVAGIIVSAVSDEILLKHPGDGNLATTLVLVGGPALFLLGCLLFKWSTAGWPPLSHMVGVAILAVLLAVGSAVPALVLGALCAAVLVMVAVWESISLAGEAAALRDNGHHAGGGAAARSEPHGRA